MKSPDICTGLDLNFKITQTLGIRGTPGFAVGDKVFNGATDLKWLQAMAEILDHDT